MTELHGVCVLGIVDMKHHTVVEEADLITVTRGYGIEAKPLLPPPESMWNVLYTKDDEQYLTSDSLGIILEAVA